MAYDKSNSGLLFKNKKHADNPRSPTMKGEGRITIDGVEYHLDRSSWL